eukprot:CAMPEP_0206544856 /NCGR_PEP_ID=MMETSP0325_2-20121206/11793_1 /ASSEMBLY_ACC=CAM_ASM_000347 /TAXON_ID=2866 /ORGANISM="Crypthecodinium cohnii, Strain Seligo" /LENGTH=408 /DNA_ID=CAMNT_0054043737 /DNA_START=14 /DNA_END=1237 /DNA_ORIENTATION=-
MAIPFRAAARVADIPPTTVWSEFTPLAIEVGAINLGQGFPAYTPDPFVRELAAAAVQSEDPMANQYCRSQGHPELVKWIQKRYSELLKRDINLAQIEVTNGTTQAINLTLQACVDAGQEVIILEPHFDTYGMGIEMASAIPKYVSLHPKGTTGNEWYLDFDELKAAITPGKTRGILFNTPQNVPGKVWTLQEMEQIAKIATENNLLIFADEVYDRLVFDGCEHISMGSLPGMFERTITMASCGKTLATTGWKVGWVVAPEPICQAIHNAQTLQSFCICTPLQMAAGRALEAMAHNGYLEDLPKRYLARREQLCDVLRDIGLTPTVPQGAFFVLADITSVPEKLYVKPTDEDIAKDWHFCRWMTRDLGVTAIPTTAFCRKESRHMYEKYIRFAFCKSEENITEAGKRLQ